MGRQGGGAWLSACRHHVRLFKTAANATERWLSHHNGLREALLPLIVVFIHLRLTERRTVVEEHTLLYFLSGTTDHDGLRVLCLAAGHLCRLLTGGLAPLPGDRRPSSSSQHAARLLRLVARV